MVAAHEPDRDHAAGVDGTSADRGGGEPDFRQLLGCFATGVTVATAVDRDGRPLGMTASAVSAVSMDPPLLLICVNRMAKLHACLHHGAGFALNILAEHQGQLSEHFASSLDDTFAGIPYSKGPDDLPLLDGVVSHIICGPWGSHEAGDHTVFFGRVLDGTIFDHRPLLHYRSTYTTVRNP